MLAKAVAHHTTAAFIRVVGSEFVQKYLGEVCYSCPACTAHCASLRIVLDCALDCASFAAHTRSVVAVICFLAICALRWRACRAFGVKFAFMAQCIVWYRARAWCVMCSGWPRRTRQPSSSLMRWTPLPQRDLMHRLELTGQALSHCSLQESGAWTPCFSVYYRMQSAHTKADRPPAFFYVDSHVRISILCNMVCLEGLLLSALIAQNRGLEGLRQVNLAVESLRDLLSA